ncbi:beta-N-acetylhexosaminidase [Pseudoduganella violacea]|uniref:Beta-N-acetylhexosaminidase n=1 Tax=Pseudoduganella violacea TaxID=1715466 RepID=A0A7W5BE38_9BURK|nr:beta-N-acetylhexosaminidase [Pseudoduganella violacea]MBB3121527.1 beta-N-acetylhexosaminidase [Pseudoduganella violacea]
MEQGLREKVGQLFMVGFDALEANDGIKRLIREKKVGGVILFRRNVHTPEQLSALCRELQDINAEVSDEPLLIALDQEGGMVMRIEQGVTPIPAAMAFQEAGSVQYCEQLTQISADEMRQIGINMLLAPVLDVNNNRLNPVIGVRSYGEEPATVIEYGLAAVRGVRSAGIAATAKHFPGHGDTAIDSHYAMALVPHDKERLRAVELAPFRAAIAQGVDAIMTAHVVFPAFEADTSVPATLSKAVLTDLLRGEMGYQGTVISDCLEMAAISEGVGIPQGAISTLLAGTDIVLISHREAQQHAAIDAVLEAVEQGRIPLARIDEAARRVQELKKVKAVQQWRERPVKPQGLMQPEAMALARKVQAEALRVQGDFRPLDPAQPVVLLTIEVRSRSEIDEVALARNKEPRSSMLPALQEAGLNVREYALSAEAKEEEVAEAIAFAKGAAQIVVQTYNAMLVDGQQKLLAALPHDKLWLVAGRMPYDLDLAPGAAGRLAAYGCRPAALVPVVAKLAGRS